MSDPSPSMPACSVIIPSLNQGQFIQKTIDSLLNQQYPRLEVIVIDGGSTDATIQILQSYGDSIRWISEPDDGQTQAINKGFSICTGDICSFLNSDDYLLPGSLQKIADAFKDDDVQWVTGDYCIVNEEGKPIQQMIVLYKKILRMLATYPLLQITNFVVQPSTFFRRRFLLAVGEFNESLRYMMDYEYWLRAYPRSKPKLLKYTLSAFRIHGQSKGGSQYQQQFAEELAVVEQFTRRNWLYWLHKLHNMVIVGIYQLIK